MKRAFGRGVRFLSRPAFCDFSGKRRREGAVGYDIRRNERMASVAAFAKHTLDCDDELAMDGYKVAFVGAMRTEISHTSAPRAFFVRGVAVRPDIA